MKKELPFILLLTIFIITTIIFLSKGSFSYEYTADNYTLFYKEDYNLLKEDIKTYIDDIDNYLIPNTSYLYSDILTNNYDFLTNFALDYIINHKEIYQDKIINLDNFTYKDVNNKEITTNEYINVEEIYKITDKYFGINNYYIINDNVNITNDYISLSDYTGRVFNSEIKDITISEYDEFLVVIISYTNLDNYKYTFKINDNVLKIYNIEVAYE